MKFYKTVSAYSNIWTKKQINQIESAEMTFLRRVAMQKKSLNKIKNTSIKMELNCLIKL